MIEGDYMHNLPITILKFSRKFSSCSNDRMVMQRKLQRAFAVYMIKIVRV